MNSRNPKFLGDKVLSVEDAEQAERKHVTILFADIPDYSAVSSKLDPEGAYEIVAGCLAIMGDQISYYGGTMTCVAGGVIKGLFGAPVSHEDHAKRACEAALSILDLVGSFREKIRKDHDADFEIRIGLVSGTIVAHSLSSETELEDFSAVDDLLPAIRKINKPGKIVVSKSTHELVRDFFEFQEIEENERDVSGYELVRSRGLPSLIRAKEAKGLSKFVGREEEISVLLEAAEEARQGRGRVVAVMGDAGVGKSRLALEFKKRLPTGRQTFLEGYCLSYDGVPPYHPLLDILKSIFGIQPGERQSSAKKKIRQRLSGLVADREEVLAPLQEIFALKVEDQRYLGLSFEEKRNRIFRAIEAVLGGASLAHMLVVIVEDLHWIDRSSEEVLNYLIGRIDAAKILLILLYRPEYTGASRLGSLTEIHLEHISPEYVKELVQSVLGASEVHDDLLALVFDKTAGNPLFVEEFTRSLHDGGSIRESEGKFTLAQDVAPTVLPKTVQDVITSRMDHLTKEVKQTLQLASVVGKEFSLALLERITESGQDIRPHISRLQELEFIREKKDREFAFKHALTQEAAYTTLLTRPKLIIHQKTAEAIEKLYSDRLEDFHEQLAYHFGKSGNVRKEFKYLKLSMIKASRQNSPWESFQFGKQALRALQGQPATQQKKKEEVEILKVMSWIARRLHYTDRETEHLLKRGEELCLEIGDANNLSFFRIELCVYYAITGNPMSHQYSEHVFQDVRGLERALSTKEDLKIMIPMFVDHSLLGLLGDRVSEVLSVNLSVLKRMEEEQALFDHYDYDVSFVYNTYACLAAMSAYFSSWLGDFDNAARLSRKALDVALEANDPFSMGFAEFCYGFVLDNRGFGEEAIEHCTRAIEHLEKMKGGSAPDTSRGNAWLGLGIAKFLVGDADGARECIERSIQLHLDGGFEPQFAHDYVCLSMAHLATGDVSKARSCIDTALDWARKCNEKHWEGLAKIFLGKIIAQSEALQAATAEALILEGIEILSKLGMKPFCAQGYLYLGELQVNTGRTELGIKNLKKSERMFKEMGMEYWPQKVQEVLDRVQKSSR